ATGNALDNVLAGNGGANVLDGGVGNDVLIGGPGNDSYVYDPADTIVEMAGGGSDTIRSDVSYTLAATNVENVLLTGSANIDATGDGHDNALTGNSGNNVLDGGAGNDAMAGAAGNDTYFVDAIGDTANESANAGTDTVYSQVSFTLGANVENLVLQGTAVAGTGNALANSIAGNSSDNVLDGGAGNDTLTGGAGNDTYFVDAGDTIVEGPGGGRDAVFSATTYLLSAALESLTLTESANVNATGNGEDNVLTGNSGNNTLEGGAGNDTLVGGL